MRSAFMSAALFSTLLFAPSAFACEHPNYFVAEHNWVKEEPFVIECLSDKPATDNVTLEKLKSAVLKEYKGLVLEVRSLPISVDVNERKNSDKIPITRVYTGGNHGLNGVIARFEKRIPNMDDIRAIMDSPVKKELVRQLNKTGFVALVIEGWDQAKNGRLLKCAERGAKLSKDMVKQRCGIVRVNISDDREKNLINNIFVDGVKKVPGILLVFGKGKGLLFFEEDDSPNMIMEIAQKFARTTDTEAQNLAPRLLLDMDIPFTLEGKMR